MNPHTRRGVLIAVTALGHNLAQLADPATYSYECRDRAEGYTPALVATRLAYSAVAKQEGNTLEVLRGLRQYIATGIVRNMLERIIEFAETGDVAPGLARTFERAGYDPKTPEKM